MNVDTVIQFATQFATERAKIFRIHGIITPGSAEIEASCSCGDPGCKSPGKHPLSRGWQDEATTDIGVIHEWFANGSGRLNYAIALDGVDWTAVEVDPYEGGRLRALREIARELGPISLSGRGFHVYYRATNLANGTRLGPGMTVRAAGYYVVAPGSRHYTGRTYGRRTYGFDRMGERPDLVIVATQDGMHQLVDASSRSSIPRAIPERILDGQERWRHLLSVTGTLRSRGLSEATALEAARAVNQNQCRPPKDDADVVRLVRYIFDHDGETAGCREEVEHRRPRLWANDPDLDQISQQTWVVLREGNHDPVHLFRVGSAPSRLEDGDDGSPVIRTLTVERLRQEMSVRADWWKTGRGGVEVPSRPPIEVARNMLAMPNIDLPILERIVEAPVFGPDGEIETTIGYHPGSRTYYSGEGLEVRPIPETPSRSDVERGIAAIDELLVDFPFASEADRLVPIVAMLGPFARALINGSTPLHLIEAPTPGTGKGLLSDIIAIPSTGRRAATLTEAANEEEWRKRITAQLRNGRAITLIDNVRGRLESAALSAALTSPMWTDRLLGVSEIVAYPVRTTWLVTGNNPALSREIARRTVRCRMDAGVDHPESRTGFRHNLPDWAYEHRPEIVWACLVLIQNWIAVGRPSWPGTPLGSLESWCRVMGGILEAGGLSGFLGNLEDFHESSDEESSVWIAFLQRWWLAFGDREVFASDLFEIAKEGLDLGSGNSSSQLTRLGKLLTQQRDRWYGELQILRRGILDGRRRYCLGRRSSDRPDEYTLQPEVTSAELEELLGPEVL